MTDVTFILWLQLFSTELLDRFFIIVTMMGNPEYYMIIIPLLYWCVNKKQAFRFTIFFLLSSYINSVIKGATGRSRPAEDRVKILYNESTRGTTSFPSGHAQGTASLWFYAAYYLKKMWLTILAVVIILLVSTSRLYLGLHYPIDVIAGIALAGVILIIFNFIYEPISRGLSNLPFILRILIPFILVPILLRLPGHDKGMVVGFAIGLLVGYQIEDKYVNFNENASIPKQIMKLIIGLGGLFGIKTGLKILFLSVIPMVIPELWADVIRYGIIGLWATCLAPWIFMKLRLSRKKTTWKYIQ